MSVATVNVATTYMYVMNHIDIKLDKLTLGALNTGVTTVNVANYLNVCNEPHR